MFATQSALVTLVLLPAALALPAVLFYAAVRRADPLWGRTTRVQHSVTGECVDIAVHGEDTITTLRNASLVTATIRVGRSGRPDRILDTSMESCASISVTLPGLRDVEPFIERWRDTTANLRVERVRERDAYVLLSVTDETGNGVVRAHRRYVEPLDS